MLKRMTHFVVSIQVQNAYVLILKNRIIPSAFSVHCGYLLWAHKKSEYLLGSKNDYILKQAKIYLKLLLSL